MQHRQKQVIESFQRVQGFLVTHPLPPPRGYGEPGALLDAVVNRLLEHGRDQVTGQRLKRASRESEKTLAGRLRRLHLKPITLIAQARLSGSPAMDEALRMPRPKLPTTKLIVVARTFRNAAAQYEEIFIQSGRPEDFLVQLDAAIDAVEKAFDEKASRLGLQVAGTAELASELAEGRDAVKMLDAIVLTTFDGQLDVLAEWRSARRVRCAYSAGGRAHRATAAGVSTSGTVPSAAASTGPRMTVAAEPAASSEAAHPGQPLALVRMA